MSGAEYSDDKRASFEELVQLVANGSEEAVWTLLDRYSKNILRVVRRHLPTEIRSKVDSTDIVQSVWKSFLRTGAKFDADTTPEKLIAYMAGMARLKVYETHRHYTTLKGFDVRKEQPLEGVAGSNESGEQRSASDVRDARAQQPDDIVGTREHWRHAMAESGERGRQIVNLRLQGLTLTEISEELKISVSTVRRTLDALLQSLTT